MKEVKLEVCETRGSNISKGRETFGRDTVAYKLGAEFNVNTKCSINVNGRMKAVEIQFKTAYISYT